MSYSISIPSRFEKLWEYRHFLSFFISREFKTRYTQSILGTGWLVIEPMLFVFTLSTIFTILGRKAPGGVPFPVYFYSALLPWQFFSSMVSSGTRCFVSDRGLMSKIPFPKEISVVKTASIAFIDFLFANVAFLLILLFFGYYPNLYWLYLPVLLLLVAILGIAFMFLLGTVNVYIRDVGILISTVVKIWFWFTPIIFSFPYEGTTKYLYYVNPMAGIVTFYREIILHGTLPDISMIYSSILIALVIFFAGYKLFRTHERNFIDVI